MPRDIDTNALAQMKANIVRPCFLAKLLFPTESVYAWTGVGNLVWNGDTYLGVGTFGSVSTINETNAVQAQGISLILSGIPTDLFRTAMTDLGWGDAAVYMGFIGPTGALIGNPIPIFIGFIDQPTIDVAADSVKITIAVENRLADLNRTRGGRYTDADQRKRYPQDGSLKYVQYLQDTNLDWHG